MTDEAEGLALSSGTASLPRAVLQKLIKDAVPPGLRVASGFQDLLAASCTEFVEMASSTANEISESQKKTTILPEHVIATLDQLGFHALKNDVAVYWQQCKEEQQGTSRGAGRRKTGADEAGMSEEEQIALQQRMFAEARAFAAGHPS